MEDTDSKADAPFYYERVDYEPFHFLATSSTENFQREVLAELHRIVKELNKINDRLSVIDTIKIPGWAKK